MDERVLNNVLTELAQRRERNEAEQDRRREAVYTVCPEVQRLAEERRRAVMTGVLSAFTAPAQPDLVSRVEKWNSEIRASLTAAGYAADYLDPIFTCPLCEDTGWVGSGKKSLCSCARALYAAQTGHESTAEESGTFEAFDLSIFPDTPLPGRNGSQRLMMNTIRDICCKFANALPTPENRTLLLYGGSGLGKTYLMQCIAKRAAEKSVPALFVTASRFLRAARDSIFSRNSEELDAITDTPLLLLDDLGTEPLIEGITVEQLFVLINERQSRRLCTVISTNLTMEDIQRRYTERVLSRLADRRNCMMLHFEGRDVRLLNR